VNGAGSTTGLVAVNGAGTMAGLGLVNGAGTTTGLGVVGGAGATIILGAVNGVGTMAGLGAVNRVGLTTRATTGIWAAVKMAFKAKAVAMITSILQKYFLKTEVTSLLINIIEIIFKSKSQFAIQANFITQL